MKFIFNILTEPLGLPIPCYLEYLILGVIGIISYKFAYKKVGDMYGNQVISGAMAGSFFHWIIRLALFVLLWAAIYGVIYGVKLLIKHWVVISLVAGSISLCWIIAYTIIKIIRCKKNGLHKS